MKKISWRGIWRQAMKAPMFAAEHAFPFTLFLILLAGICSMLLFSLYGFSGRKGRVDQGASLHDVKEELFSDTIGELERRKAILEGVGTEVSRDIFNSAKLTEK